MYPLVRAVRSTPKRNLLIPKAFFQFLISNIDDSLSHNNVLVILYSWDQDIDDLNQWYYYQMLTRYLYGKLSAN